MGASRPGIPIQVQIQKIATESQKEILQISDEDKDKVFNFYKDIYDTAYEKHKTYTTLVISAGYVIFFNIWKSLKDDLPKGELLFSGVLITISVCLFISYEVYKMISDGLFYQGINKLITLEASIETISEIQKKEKEHKRNFYSIWFSFLLPTVLTAIFGAFFLVSGFLREIFCEFFKS